MDQCDRLKAAMDSSQRSPADLAAACGVSVQAVYKWLRDPNMNLKNEHLFAISDLMRHEARWIATGRGPKKPGGDATTASEPTTAYRVISPDVVSSVVVGIHSMLKLAGVPTDCLGHTSTLHAAIKAGKSPASFTISIIQTASIEVLKECAPNIADLTPEQIADLIADKLAGWIDPPPSIASPSRPPQHMDNSPGT